MGNLLFSPSGRIGPSAYMKGMLILGVISAVIALLPFFSVGLALAANVIGIVLIIPLIFMSIKRAHDAGKSGWMSILAIAIMFGVSIVLGLILAPIFAGMLGNGVDEAALEAAAETGDLSAVMDAAGTMAKATAIPSAISSLVAYGATAFLFNMFNKQDMGDNQYGPVPVA